MKKLGTYTVKADELKGGAPDGTTVTNYKVVVRDWLIVGLGDSNGSGQGNPPYIYDQCDRSESSHQYLVAKYVEDHDPRSSVTFLWASCSGARSDQIWRNTYEGQEASKGSTLPPQLDQIEGGHASTRKVDAVLMSIGINDIFFGPIMGFCTTYGTRINPEQPANLRVGDGGLGARLAGLHERIHTIAGGGRATLEEITNDRIRESEDRLPPLSTHARKLDPAHVFLTQYPEQTTDARASLHGRTAHPRISRSPYGASSTRRGPT